MNPTQLSESVYVFGQIMPSDVTTLKERGFGTIICNRPDGEDPDQPTAQEIKAAAEEAGLSFFFVPFSPMNPSPTIVEEFSAALDGAGEGLILAYCRSGNRSSHLWQASGCR